MAMKDYKLISGGSDKDFKAVAKYRLTSGDTISCRRVSGIHTCDICSDNTGRQWSSKWGRIYACESHSPTFVWNRILDNKTQVMKK